MEHDIPGLEKTKLTLLKLWHFTKEIDTYGEEIEKFLGNEPQASPETLDKLNKYKLLFHQDYRRFAKFIQDEMWYHQIEPIRDYVTQTSGNADRASNVIHSIIGCRDALSEGIQGFESCMGKISDELKKPQKTNAAENHLSLDTLIRWAQSFIR